MSYSIQTLPHFAKELKKLAKKHKSLKDDFRLFLQSLQDNPLQGVDLGHGIRKIRMQITDKKRGKSGGARVISHNAIIAEHEGIITLLTIYDKSYKSTVSDNEISELMRQMKDFQ